MTVFGDQTPTPDVQPAPDLEPAVDPDSDPAALAAAIDVVLDEAQEALASGDAASAGALLTAAEATSDALLDALAVPDVDDAGTLD